MDRTDFHPPTLAMDLHSTSLKGIARLLCSLPRIDVLGGGRKLGPLRFLTREILSFLFTRSVAVRREIFVLRGGRLAQLGKLSEFRRLLISPQVQSIAFLAAALIGIGSPGPPTFS